MFEKKNRRKNERKKMTEKEEKNQKNKYALSGASAKSGIHKLARVMSYMYCVCFFYFYLIVL